MRKILLFLLAIIGLTSQLAEAQSTIRIFNRVLFYDGYAARIDSPAPPAGIIRHRNDLYARRLSGAELAQIGSRLQINVVIRAACDNYDRIGNVNLALVPKADTAYHPDSVQRLELARFITPFMNKNFWPDTVPYTFQADNVAQILRDSALRANYDFWVELQVFGVPYAAQQQVGGCTRRNDVFFGTLDFVTDAPLPVEGGNVLLPMEFMHNLNNYDSTATDTVGKTTRTITVFVPEPLSDASLFLITSNHGANANGEEYNRRWHYVYVDDSISLTYKPGRPTCEPFRRYNTQGNGIYGPSPRSNAAWQSFSNWCPGDVITTRMLHLGPLDSGSHRFLIRVPDAVFANREGYFPVSWYLQGRTTGYVATQAKPKMVKRFRVYPNPAIDLLSIEGPSGVGAYSFELTDGLGRVFISAKAQTGSTAISLHAVPPGIYSLRILTSHGTEVHKMKVGGY